MTERLDRELSWINYNNRILEEGLRKDLPPLARFRFLSIVSSNFDEFFMVRIAALKRVVLERAALSKTAFQGNAPERGERAAGPAQLLDTAVEMIRPLYDKLYNCLNEEIFPALASGGLELRRPPFTHDETGYLKPLFMREIFPALTPLRFGPVDDDPAEPDLSAKPDLPTESAERLVPEPLPAIANGILYGAFLLAGAGPEIPETERRISIVEIPPAIDRVILIDSGGPRQRWALLDDLLMLWGGSFFPGYEVKERVLFRIYRDADFSVDERRDDDFIEAMEEVLINRDRSPAVQIVYSPWNKTPEVTDTAPLTTDISQAVIRRLGLSERDAFSLSGPLDPVSLDGILRIQGFEALKLKTQKPRAHPAFSPDIPVWETLQGAGDILLSLPYQSFDPVIRFFQEAATDPLVLSIKTTLYRTSGNSPIVRALEQAALNGKQVTALVEIKARFDEERNISWANRLERAGVIVIYGLARLKVHAKICQVIRREESGLVRYLHFSTGNYNDKTARLYSDLSLFSRREDFGHDATILFNMLSGYSATLSMRFLVIAPRHLKQRLIDLIDREAKRAKEGLPGRITAKMNALVDDDVAAALYRASKAGVTINLNIRGVCTLVPGLPGLSENIKVVSIIDQFLEHSRIFYFNHGGAEEFFISSADWMPRNLERRVELLIPVLDEGVREELRVMLEAYFKDNTHAWILDRHGNWERLKAQEGGEVFRAQDYLQSRAEKAAEQHWKSPQEFTVRRSAPENER
ncbi:MAG: polyphosphate kinase 1 [Spirochaetaceae bacterium]|jgi:polyphosphate kinase|nr:polyphosphate kinase 1 [Spirochaetaceae bacterium]